MNADAIRIAVLKNGTRCVVKDMAETLDVSLPTVIQKLKGRTAWRADEIDKMRIKYGLTDAEVVEMFIKGEANA